MRLTIDKLRAWLLAAAALLVCVIVVFLGYAQYRMHRLVRDLPRRLGIDIQQETNHFTYVQTIKGRTVFTIHAAKMVQMKTGGKVTLHDVDITLNGRSGDRTDHISGSEFEYDTVNQVMTAKGEVHIDLQPPSGAKPAGSAAKEGAQPALGANGEPAGVIHVKTSGLVFLEKLALAATSEETEFQFNGVTGRAHGAEYDSDRGLLVLQSAVQVNTMMRGRPVVVNAEHAEVTRDDNQAVLTRAAYSSLDIDGNGQSGSASLATIHMRRDGTIERVDASGDVTLKTDDGGFVSAPRAQVAMGPQGQPQRLDMAGGVRFEYAQAATSGANRQAARVGAASASAAQRAQGSAEQAHAIFGVKSQIQQVLLVHAVHIAQRAPEEEGSASARSIQRDLAAENVEIAFAPDAKGHAQARSMKAVGGGNQARMLITTQTMAGRSGSAQPATVGLKRHPSPVALQQIQTQSTLLTGDELDGQLAPSVGGKSSGAMRFSRIQGTGHTGFEQNAADGSKQTSTGDILDVKLANPSATGRGANTRKPADESMDVESATQQGHVRITQTQTASAGKPGPAVTAVADFASYQGSTQQLELTGSPQVQDGGMTLWAKKISLQRVSGDVAAIGDVKGSLLRATAKQGAAVGAPSAPGSSPAGPAQQAHVVADHAQLRHADQKAFFYGTISRNARLWQGPSQVEAPLLEFDQKAQTLVASAGELAGKQAGPAVVHAVFLNAAGSAEGKVSAGKSLGAATPPAKAPAAQGVARVASRQMIYSDAKHEADFSGAVTVESADGRMRAQSVAVMLQGAAPKPAPGAASKPGAAAAAVPASAPSVASGAGQGNLFGGSVEQVVAQGDVSVDQPGRRATGDRLVYTAADGKFILTGTIAAPPKMVDQANGTVTGAALIFHSADDSVVVSSGASNGKQRTQTDTTVKH